VQVPDDEEWAFENEIDLWDDGASPRRRRVHPGDWRVN
jgi:hypothetical protein